LLNIKKLLSDGTCGERQAQLFAVALALTPQAVCLSLTPGYIRFDLPF
jgi:hypothetical protein